MDSYLLTVLNKDSRSSVETRSGMAIIGLWYYSMVPRGDGHLVYTIMNCTVTAQNKKTIANVGVLTKVL